ncbi:MAG TPA: TonB-dependent receptor [Verrucomicrobiae bacterium]|nr:TonB-dependent receptor [Verrucomicrobiae bacterium]
MMSRKSLFTGAVALLACSVVCLAQVEQGAITGAVTDATGASIPAAKVTATNQATNAVGVAETTVDGYYKIPYLQAGKYTVTVEKDGFTTSKTTDVPVLVGETATINASLQTGSLHDQITVESRSVLIEQSSSSLGYVTGVTQILELPIGRSPYSMLTLSPGVIPDGNTGTGPIVNGGRSNTTAILMDGQDTRNNSTLDNNYTPPQESIQEIRFITNSFSAEYGRSNGGVLAAAGKTGTNLIHGSAYDYLQNDDLNANSWTSNKNGVARGRQRLNTFGGTISGPVFIPKLYNGKNKTFFFFNVELVGNHGVTTPTADVPTDLQRSGDFSQTFTSTGAQIVVYDPATTVPSTTTQSGYIRSPFPGNVIPANRIDPTVKNILKYFPEPTLSLSPTLGVNWSRNFPLITWQQKYFTRVDQNFGDKNRLFFRFGYQLSPQTSPYLNSPYASIAFPGETTNGGGNQRTTAYIAGISDTETFSPTLVGEFRVGLARSLIQLTPLSVGFDVTSLGLPNYLKQASLGAIFPLISITDFTAIGPQRASWDIDSENTPEAQAHFTWLKGAHSVKTGVDILWCQFNTFRPDYPSGTFSFSRAYTQGPNPSTASATAGYGLASAMLGEPDGGSFTVGPSLATLQKSYNWYLQDDWKVSRTLTLNLGVRFEYTTPWKDRYYHLDYFSSTTPDPVTGTPGSLVQTTPSHPYPSNTYHNWGPRVGLAWSFLPNTVLRAAYGLFYAPGAGGIGSSPGDFGSGSEATTGIYFGQAPAAPSTPVPGGTLANPFVTGLLSYPNALVGSGISSIFPSWETPMNQMWNANLQRTVSKNLLLELAYVGSRGEHLWNNFTEDATYPQYLSLGTQLNNLVPNPYYGKITSGSLSAATVRYGALLTPFPQYTGVTQIRGSVGDSVYHGMTLRAERSFTNGLLFQASYTAAKLIDDVNERFLGGSNYVDPYNLRLSRAISPWDVSQRFVANYVYALPFGHGKRFLSKGIASWVLGNWQNSSIVQFQTGTPISITASCNFAGAQGYGCQAVRSGTTSVSNPSMAQWFNTAAFTNPPAYSFGADSRTEPNLRNPGTISFDSALSRWQPIHERMRVQFRADMYNILNHPNLGAPSASVTSSTFGQITTKSSNRTVTMSLRLEF